MTTPHKLYPPIAGLRGDEGENDAILVVAAVLTTSPHYPDAGRIIVGSPGASDAEVGGWSSGPEAAVQLAETLLEAARDVDAALDAERPVVFRFGVESSPDVDVLEDLTGARCESCCAELVPGEPVQAFWEELEPRARVVFVHAERCPGQWRAGKWFLEYMAPTADDPRPCSHSYAALDHDDVLAEYKRLAKLAGVTNLEIREARRG